MTEIPKPGTPKWHEYIRQVRFNAMQEAAESDLQDHPQFAPHIRAAIRAREEGRTPTIDDLDQVDTDQGTV